MLRGLEKANLIQIQPLVSDITITPRHSNIQQHKCHYQVTGKYYLSRRDLMYKIVRKLPLIRQRFKRVLNKFLQAAFEAAVEA